MGGIKLKRLALNMDQIEHYHPPPNPAKSTDSRFADYQAKFGDESWELDALEPAVLVGLIRNTVETMRDHKKWEAKVKIEEHHRHVLAEAASRWDEVEAMVDE